MIRHPFPFNVGLYSLSTGCSKGCRKTISTLLPALISWYYLASFFIWVKSGASPHYSSKKTMTIRIYPYRFLYLFTLLMLAVSIISCGGQQPVKNNSTLPTCSREVLFRPEAPMAKVNDQVITAKELEEVIADDLAQAATKYQEEIREIRKQALEIMIVERLVEARATRESITPDELLQREIQARIAKPSEEEIKEVYDATAEKFGGNFPAFEEVEATIREAVQRQLEESAQTEYFDELMATAKIDILLPPVIPDAREVPTKGPSKGNPNAPVTIVEFADFECPFCSRAQATVDRILETYGDDIRYIFRDFPMPFHSFAQKAAEAAHCAGEQGKYWEMHALLFENSDALAVADLKTYATQIDLDSEQFNTCLDASSTAPLVKESLALVKKLGIRGSPTFFINGRQISGAQPFERFKEVIDSELKAASQQAK